MDTSYFLLISINKNSIYNKSQNILAIERYWSINIHRVYKKLTSEHYMKTITAIDERIERLKKQKEELTRKVSLSLYAELSKKLGKDFSPELALSIISSSWKNANEETKEGWKNSASSFHHRKRKKSKNNNPASK